MGAQFDFLGLLEHGNLFELISFFDTNCNSMKLLIKMNHLVTKPNADKVRRCACAFLVWFLRRHQYLNEKGKSYTNPKEGPC